MIGYIKGKLTYKADNKVIIETGGIGYNIIVPDNSPLFITNEGEDVQVYIIMIVKEDDISLYGFPDKESVKVFNKLITVSGIGAKAAMAILSVMPISEVVKAIVFEDVAMITRANGVGKKSAERLILELKDKMGGIGEQGMSSEVYRPTESDAGSPQGEAIEALISLGYTRTEASAAVSKVKDEGLATEEYVREALKLM